MLTTAHIQEALSRSYIHAVAGQAGVNCELGREFDYGFDGTFRAVVEREHRRVESGFPLDFQLKCTWNWSATETDIIYHLKSKNYNDLVTRDAKGVGAVLIVMCLPNPDDGAQWVEISEEQIILRKCCYFTSLTGKPTNNENSTKLVKIPRTNLLTADNLKEALAAERNRRVRDFA